MTKLTIKLSAEQSEQIKQATGELVTELTINVGSSSNEFPPGPSAKYYPPGPTAIPYPPGPSVTAFPPGPTAFPPGPSKQ